MTHSRPWSVTGAHVQTTREQLQQQRFYIFRLTPMKCPHLLPHEMTVQVDSRALDQFLSSPHVVSYPAVVSSCSAELWLVLGKDGLRHRLRSPCNSEHSFFIGQYSTNGRRITLQPNLSVATRPTLYIGRLAPHSTLACPKHHASRSHRGIQCIRRWQTATRHGCLCRVSRSVRSLARKRD